MGSRYFRHSLAKVRVGDLAHSRKMIPKKCTYNAAAIHQGTLRHQHHEENQGETSAHQVLQLVLLAR